MNGIRKSFLEFFKKNEHEICASAPLVPYQDDSLLFVNAGMVPFKDFFLKKRKAVHQNIATSQKCIRAGGKHNDLENVGFTKRHHTFFEMLGNFSFGSYFKERAIYFAWRFLINELALKKERLYITVYHDDDEAYAIWKKISGLTDNKIIRITTDDNFWQMGDTGPCGPCSEIFYDHGDNLPGVLPDKGDTGERFVEIWNLVFMEFNKSADSTLSALPEKCIDTGMGLERISAIIEGTDDNYETEIFRVIIKECKNIVKNDSHPHAYRIIADHLRSSSFLIAEGIIPSNQGRGYVLRRIIRRAVRYTYMLGYNKPLLGQILPILQNYMGDTYPQLIRAKDSILNILEYEEHSFRSTLSRGVDILDGFSKDIKNNVLSGSKAFMLYDTYGFPFEITKEILAERNISVDKSEFEICMQGQRDRARKSWLGLGSDTNNEQLFTIYEHYGITEFVGYHEKKIQCKIIGIVNSEETADEKIFIILSKTPFYAESGGQEGDKGRIYNESLEVEVIYTRKLFNAIYLHECIVKSGKPEVGSTVFAEIDLVRRTALQAAHSATHILHYALRFFLGKHITQKGSLVSEDRLRLDFNHTRALMSEEITSIERFINSFIWKNFPVTTDIKKIEEAFEDGALGLFGEKYENDVRVITIGDSKELCGGTHVCYSGDIGFFKIITECSVASGIRRIEGLTRFKALDFINKKNSELQNTIIELNDKINAEKKKNDSELYVQSKRIVYITQKNEEKISGITYLTQVIHDISVDHTRRIITEYKESISSAVIAIVNIYKDKATLIVGITKELSNKISAISLMQIASSSMKIKGGGRADLAQCACSIDKLQFMFSLIREHIKNILG